jgi:predicted nuclease of predicted toxin-antitoxin system
MAASDAAALRSAGHDVVFAGDWSRDPGDPEVLRRAFMDSRVLVTLDKGFSALLFKRRMPHAGVILLRTMSVGGYPDQILRAITLFGPELESGRMVVVRKNDIRLASSTGDRA